MKMDTETVVSLTDAQQDLSRVIGIAEKNGRAVILKDDRPRYVLVDIEKQPLLALTDDEKIDIAAARILKRFQPAFEELAK